MSETRETGAMTNQVIVTATKIIWGEQMALTVARELQDVQESFDDALGGFGATIGETRAGLRDE